MTKGTGSHFRLQGWIRKGKTRGRIKHSRGVRDNCKPRRGGMSWRKRMRKGESGGKKKLKHEQGLF